ncbi:MAG: hypothetical protein NTW87_11445 [Planctomycetota bacterium]|nr:hypothetical protein [Planctomycetota bacterium]
MMTQVIPFTRTHGDVAAGAARGRAILGELIASLRPASERTLVAVDFAATSVVTASCLRESLLAFRDYCRKRDPSAYPIVVNMSEETVEELRVLLDGTKDAVVAGSLTPAGQVTGPRVVGWLDTHELATLRAVASFGGKADAPSLKRKHEEEHIGVTAWNNRLSALAAKGILLETRQGKSKFYIPVVEGL